MINKASLGLIICLLFLSCGGSKKDRNYEVDATTTAKTQIDLSPPADASGYSKSDKKGEAGEELNSESGANPKDSKQVDKKKIIKNGTISIKSDDISISKNKLDLIVKSLNSYYEKEDFQNSTQTISFNLKIRIPTDNFQRLITEIEKGSDEITSKSIQATDVTEEYVDVETRIKSKKAYLQKYMELLAKATSIKDILDIQEKIGNLQEEIESTEGRLKYLNDQVGYSTLDIYLFKDKEFIYKPQQQDKFSERLKKSLSNGWAALVDFLLWLVSVFPFIILIGLAIFIFRRIRRRRKNS
jgi:hypothetical protein